MGAALRNGGRIVVENVVESEMFDNAARKVMLDACALAVQSTPLTTRSGEILGMFSTHYGRSGEIPERDLRWIDLLARQAADLIERRRADHAVRASEERLRVAQTAAKIGVFDWNMGRGLQRLSPLFTAFIPAGTSVNPVTKSNWENIGVKPDVEVPAEKAIAEAHALALRRIAERELDPMWLGELRKAIEDLASTK